jgi:Ser/Thr protein kinase RdoA (MazF antagonist)
MTAHLVHGMGKALEAPTWPVITQTEAEAILAQFARAGQVERLAWHSPRPFSAATLVQTDLGAFVLKRHHHRLRSVSALVEEHAFMAHLRAGNLSVPEVMTTCDGASAVEHDGLTYELQREAPGIDLYRDRPSWTPFLTPDHGAAAGAALARLHLASRGFAGAERSAHPLVASFTILPAEDPLAAAVAYVEARPALARFLADKPWQAELTRLFATFGDGLAKRLSRCAPLWTHNDWHPSNLLWSAEGHVTTIFDFGLAAPACALHDLATAIERTAIGWLDLSEPGAHATTDVEATVRLLDGYRTLLPLSSDEIDTICRLLPLVHLEFALSEVDYFAGILDDPDQAELAWTGYAIGHADWFASPEGQDFVRQLKCKATA